MDASRGPSPPPPPPPPGSGGGGGRGPMQLPPHLQAMMREVQATLGGQQQQHRNDQQLPTQFGNSHGRGGGRGLSQHHNNNHGSNSGRGHRGGRGQRGGGRSGGGGRGSGGRGGRGGRGGGRGGFHNNQQHGQQQHYGPTKRKRDFDGNGAARFFLPSCLEDPWLPLLQPRVEPASTTYTAQLPQASTGQHQPHQQHQHQSHQQHTSRPGRVLFQPSFLNDPWVAFVR